MDSKLNLKLKIENLKFVRGLPFRSPERAIALSLSKCRGTKEGLSLIELLIVTFVLGIIILLIGSIFVSNLRLTQNQNAQIEASNQNRLILDEIANQIRQAQSVAFKCCGPPPEHTTFTVLVLKLWPQDPTTTAPCDPTSGGSCPTDYDYVIYRRNGSQLIKQVVPVSGSLRPPSTDILSSVLKTTFTSLYFDYYDQNDVAIPLPFGSFAASPDADKAYHVVVHLTTQVKVGTGSQKFATITQETRATLRNKP